MLKRAGRTLPAGLLFLLPLQATLLDRLTERPPLFENLRPLVRGSLRSLGARALGAFVGDDRSRLPLDSGNAPPFSPLAARFGTVGAALLDPYSTILVDIDGLGKSRRCTGRRGKEKGEE